MDANLITASAGAMLAASNCENIPFIETDASRLGVAALSSGRIRLLQK
jgi:hypothetical protein